MNRLTSGALAQDCLSQDSATTDEWQEAQRLPFNSDSPAWTRIGHARDAVQARMTHLVKALESEVIPRLLQAHRVVPHGLLPLVSQCPPPTEKEVQDFVRLVLAPEDVPIAECIADKSHQGGGNYPGDEDAEHQQARAIANHVQAKP